MNSNGILVGRLTACTLLLPASVQSIRAQGSEGDNTLDTIQEETTAVAELFVGDIDFDDLLPSYGVGIRYMASEEQRVNPGIDYARGDDSDAWCFRIGEAF